MANLFRVTEDAAWDGLKGYITNTKLSAEQVVSKLPNGENTIQTLFLTSEQKLVKTLFEIRNFRVTQCQSQEKVHHLGEYSDLQPYKT